MLKSNDRLRQRLAQEAAKIISTEGVHDFQVAKHKASQRLGNSHHGSLPSNFEIEDAITTFQKTFLPDHELIVEQLRFIALQVMQKLNMFSPFLVGPVLQGRINLNTVINIHTYSDTVEDVLDNLSNYAKDLEIHERRYKLNNEYTYCPVVTFQYQETPIDITLFTIRQKSQIPKSKSQNRSIERANIKKVIKLINQTSEKLG